MTCKPAFFARAPLHFPTSEAVSPQFPAPFSRRVPWFPREPRGDSPLRGPGAGEAAPCMRQAREKGSVWFRKALRALARPGGLHGCGPIASASLQAANAFVFPSGGDISRGVESTWTPDVSAPQRSMGTQPHLFAWGSSMVAVSLPRTFQHRPRGPRKPRGTSVSSQSAVHACPLGRTSQLPGGTRAVSSLPTRVRALFSAHLLPRCRFSTGRVSSSRWTLSRLQCRQSQRGNAFRLVGWLFTPQGCKGWAQA